MNYNNILKYSKSKLLLFTPFTIFVLLLVFFAMFSLVKQQEIKLQKQVVTIEVVGQNWVNMHSQGGYLPPTWIAEHIRIGANELSPDGREIAKIIDIDVFEYTNYSYKLHLDVEIETVDNFSSGKTIYKGTNVSIGSQLDFNFDNTSIIGTVIEIKELNRPKKFKKVEISGTAMALSPEAASLVAEGMQIVNPYNGRVYATILSKKVFPSTKNYIYNDNSTKRISIIPDYEVKDVDLTLEILVEERMGNFYFSSGTYKVKVGEEIKLFFPTFNIYNFRIKNVSVIQ